jgi:iron complex outermembrane receptor protein
MAVDSNRFNLDYTYLFNNALPNLNIETRASYYRNTQEVNTKPTLLPAGVPGFPDGVIGAPGYKEEQSRIDISSIYKGFAKHILRLGFGGYWGNLYKTSEQKNFTLDITKAFPFVPKATGVTDVSGTPEVFLPEKKRTNYYLFLQDEWQFVQDWALTSGVRYDHYSDFGDTTNPRLALVWATTDTITTKLLYGRAFRAPSFAELFATANPVALGNPDLKPETIDTYELAFSHQVKSNFKYSANLFYYKIKDLILFIPGSDGIKAQNTGGRKGKGGEFELEYSPSNSVKIIGNYSYQKSLDNSTNKDVGEAPNQEVYGRLEWIVASNWRIDPQVNWVGKQKRAPNDTRTDPVHEYTTFDLTIRRVNIIDKLEASLSVRNLFNAAVYEPSPVGGVKNDFPMAGRSLFGEIAYNF